jgi:hypothetical protein
MPIDPTIFAQLTQLLPRPEFRRCVQRYRGHHKVKSFTCWEQFLCLAFAQLTYRESLRDIETCLRAVQPKLYHMGIRARVSRSTLADANESRDWRIFADFAHVLIAQARPLYRGEEFGADLDATVYALDSTTVDLCLKLFPWAPFQRSKAAVKLHTLLDLHGNIPEFIHISDGRMHDVRVLDLLRPRPGAFYVMDRGYLDFKRLHALHRAGAFFVIRARKNLQCQRRYSAPVDKDTGVRCDQTVVLTGKTSATDYPEVVRRVRYRDPDTGRTFVFLTNAFDLPALLIAQLYKARWQVELFFKWIKQHLRIKAFYGTSPNAVKTQVWVAIAVYVLVALLKKRLHLPHSLYTILQILSVTLLEKTPILQAFSAVPFPDETQSAGNQLELLGL